MEVYVVVNYETQEVEGTYNADVWSEQEVIEDVLFVQGYDTEYFEDCCEIYHETVK